MAPDLPNFTIRINSYPLDRERDGRQYVENRFLDGEDVTHSKPKLSAIATPIFSLVRILIDQIIFQASNVRAKSLKALHAASVHSQASLISSQFNFNTHIPMLPVISRAKDALTTTRPSEIQRDAGVAALTGNVAPDGLDGGAEGEAGDKEGQRGDEDEAYDDDANERAAPAHRWRYAQHRDCERHPCARHDDRR